MTKEEVYKKIRYWENDAGESFVDYFNGEINIYNFMFWCSGRGHITREQFNQWEEAVRTKDYKNSANYIIGGSSISYSLCGHDNWEKGLMILAEFISESTTYLKRLNKFIVEYDEEGAEDDEE